VAAESATDFDLSYQTGVAHLQAGEWADAVRCFEELVRQHPQSSLAQSALTEAQFKAGLTAKPYQRAVQWFVRWRPTIARGALFLALAGVAIVGGRALFRQVVPVLAYVQEQGRQAQLAAEADAFLQAGDLDAAEARYTELLSNVPEHKEALAGLEQVAEQRELTVLYEEALAFQEAGDWEAALGRLSQISRKDAQYRDVSLRLTEVQYTVEMEGLLTSADEDYQAGRTLDALDKYEQLRQLDLWNDTLAGRLVELHIRAGRELVDTELPTSDAVQQAVDHFREALAIEPRNAEATEELRVALLFLEGRSYFHREHWLEAIDRLSQLYEQRPGRWAVAVIDMLYEAYVQAGDIYQEEGNVQSAYEHYQKASELPVDDGEWAFGRMAALATPTPTPSPTPVPVPILAPIKDRVDVRSGPGTNFTLMGQIARGTEARIIGRYEDWWQIEYKEAQGWVSSEGVTTFYGERAPLIDPTSPAPTQARQPAAPSAPPTPTPLAPSPEARGLVVVAYYVPRAPGPFGPGQDIWFNFSITNESENVVSYNALGTWVEETGQFQKSWTYSVLTPGATLTHRDHINMSAPGDYHLWLAIHFSDGLGVLLSGPIRVVVQ
jgi:tetratricopeptide (TPR) repeat protein